MSSDYICKGTKTNNTEIPKCCVHCNHSGICRNGTIRGKPRFKCKQCKKSFSINAHSINFGSGKSSDYWHKYIEFMTLGYSLRKTVREMKKQGLPISLVTAFDWRHKILNFLKKDKKFNLTGKIEVDEIYFFQSSNVIRSIVDENSFDSKVVECVSIGVDCNNKIYLSHVCQGRMSNADFKKNLATSIDFDNSVLLVKAREMYVLDDKTPEFRVVNENGLRGQTSSFPLIDICRSNLNSFLIKFRGVATKYFNNYLSYWQWHRCKYDHENFGSKTWILEQN